MQRRDGAARKRRASAPGERGDARSVDRPRSIEEGVVRQSPTARPKYHDASGARREVVARPRVSITRRRSKTKSNGLPR